MSVVRVKFGEVVSSLNETVRQGEEHSLTRVVGLEHIEPQDPDLRRWDELSDLPDGTSFSRVFRRGQVLFGKRRAYQRKVAVAPFDGICSSDILVFTPANKKLHPDFLLFIVQSEGFFSHALQTSSGSLSPRTRWQDLAAFEFELPPIEEQQRIVELLSGVDAHAEALRSQLHIAKETRKSVLHHLLNAGGDDWTKTTLKGMLQVFIGGIWGSDPGIEELDVRIYRQTEFTDGGDLVMPSEAVRSVTSSQLKARRLQSGDVLLQKSAGTPSLPGRVVRIPSGIEEDSTCSNFLQLLRANTKICFPDFLFYSLWVRHATGGALDFQRGTNIRNLDLNAYFSQSVSLPPLDEQQRIVDEILKIDSVIDETTSALNATQQLRAALLNKEIS